MGRLFDKIFHPRRWEEEIRREFEESLRRDVYLAPCAQCGVSQTLQVPRGHAPKSVYCPQDGTQLSPIKYKMVPFEVDSLPPYWSAHCAECAEERAIAYHHIYTTSLDALPRTQFCTKHGTPEMIYGWVDEDL